MMKPYEPPQQDAYDHVERAARALATLIPGGSALMTYIQAPVDFRRGQWMKDVAEGLRKLEEKFGAIDPEKLMKSDEFVTAFLHASQAAIRTHHQEKREALRNAVLNMAAGRAPGEELQSIFLNLVDTLTPLHLKMLKFYFDPVRDEPAKSMIPTMSGGLGRVLEAAIPELRDRRDLYDVLHGDLVNRGLALNFGLQVMMSSHGLAEKRTSAIGEKFLNFISSPIDA